jgi:hypothetical protein
VAAAANLAALALDRYDGRDLAWELVGHGRPGLDCGRVRKLGHARIDGRWCLWDGLVRCKRSDCPACFSESGGYVDRESKEATARLAAYFEMRNDPELRESFRTLANRRGAWRSESSVARDIRLFYSCSEPRAREVARRMRALAQRDLGRSRVRRPVHVIVAPPPSRWEEVHSIESYRALREEAYHQAAARGADGGLAVFHHARLRSSRWDGNLERFGAAGVDRCVDGPHWHVVGDGWISEVHRCEEVGCGQLSADGRRRTFRTVGSPDAPHSFFERLRCPDWHEGVDWIVRNLGLRASVRETLRYLLTHASVSSRIEPWGPSAVRETTSASGQDTRPSGTGVSGRRPVQTVTWFGRASYAAFEGPDPNEEPSACARCGELVEPADVVPVRYLGTGPPPPGDLAGDPREWRAEEPDLDRNESRFDRFWSQGAAAVSFSGENSEDRLARWRREEEAHDEVLDREEDREARWRRARRAAYLGDKWRINEEAGE